MARLAAALVAGATRGPWLERGLRRAALASIRVLLEALCRTPHARRAHARFPAARARDGALVHVPTARSTQCCGHGSRPLPPEGAEVTKEWGVLRAAGAGEYWEKLTK